MSFLLFSFSIFLSPSLFSLPLSLLKIVERSSKRWGSLFRLVEWIRSDSCGNGERQTWLKCWHWDGGSLYPRLLEPAKDGGDSPFEGGGNLTRVTWEPAYCEVVWDVQICCILANAIYTIFLFDCIAQEGEGQRSDYHLQPPHFPFIWKNSFWVSEADSKPLPTIYNEFLYNLPVVFHSLQHTFSVRPYVPLCPHLPSNTYLCSSVTQQ